MNIKVLSILFAASLLTTIPAMAREKKEKAKTEQTTQPKKPSKKSKKGQPEASPKDTVKVEKPSIDRDGLFHVTKEKNDWYFQISDSLLGRQFLTTTRFTSTPAGSGKFGGEQVNEQTVYFQKGVDEQLLLRANLIINVADSTDNISRAITISNENPIIGSFKIESHKDGKYKIKVTQFFNQDNAAIALPQNAKKQYELQGLIPDMSYIEDIKSLTEESSNLENTTANKYKWLDIRKGITSRFDTMFAVPLDIPEYHSLIIIIFYEIVN